MNFGFEQAISPRGNKKGNLNPYQIFICKQTSANHKQMSDLLQNNLEKIKKKNQLTQQLQNTSFDQVSRVSFRPKPSTNPNIEEEEKIGRISTSVKETMIVLEECQIYQGKPSQLFVDTDEIVIIQTKVRQMLAKKRLFKLKKQHKYRYLVLQELCTTEKSYCSILNNMIANYMIPLKNILTSKELKGLFSNVESIFKLSQQTLEILNEKLQTFAIHSIIADQELISLTSFFKIYSEYLINYNQAFKLQLKLKKENPKYKSIIDQDKSKSLDNYYLIQPVQRIPKYVLLFKDLLKNTNLEHPDYKNIEKILFSFEKVANENNNQMEILLKNSKIFELQKQYGNFVKIVEASREFIKEESLQMYFTKEREVRPVIVYFLSDLILITERDQVKQEYILTTHIKLNHISQCQKLPEMNHYQHVFQINGVDNSVTFVVDTKDSEKDILELVDLVEKMINKLEEKYKEREKRSQVDKNSDLQKLPQQQGVSIQIQGTQELLDASGKKFTQYVFEIDIKNIIQKIFLRFSQFKKIQEEVKQKFPKIKAPYIKEESYFDRNEAAIVDQRKIGIVEFLQILLNSKEFQSDMINQQHILVQIGLPENFYELPTLLSNKQKQTFLQNQFSFRSSKKPQSMHIESFDNLMKIRNFDHSNTTTLMAQAITPRGPVKPMADVVKLLQQNEKQQEQQKPPSPNIKGLRAASLANSRKISATQLITMESRGNSRQGSITSNDQINLLFVTIKVMVFQKLKQVEKEYSISKDTSAFQLLEEIANDIKLQSAYDFRLYQIDSHYLKPLDHDEKLWNLLVKIDDSKGIFKKAQKTAIYNEKKLQLRKHLYVSDEEEKEYYKQDLVRLELISYQIFDDISTFKLMMTPKDHVMYTALYLFLNGHKKIDVKKFPFNEIKEFVPQIAYKTIPSEQWVSFLPTLISNFEVQIKILQDEDMKECKQKQQWKQEQKHQAGELNDQLTESSQGECDSKTEQHYAMLVFLDLIKSARFYGVTNYPVRPDKECLKYISELSKIYWENKKKENKQFENHQIDDCLCWQSLYLSVSHKSLIILQSLKSQLEQVEIDYADISSISSLQQSLAIYLDQMPTNSSSLQINKKICLKFETEKSFQIKSLIDEYVKLQIESQQAENLLCDEILDHK